MAEQIGAYNIPISFKRILMREETIALIVQDKEVVISISPTPMSNRVLVSVLIDRVSIVHNKIRTFGEPFINRSYLFKGDFYLMATDDRDLDFRIEELEIRGELIYVDEREE